MQLGHQCQSGYNTQFNVMKKRNTFKQRS